jgi:RNA recognition motif-containing protein
MQQRGGYGMGGQMHGGFGGGYGGGGGMRGGGRQFNNGGRFRTHFSPANHTANSSIARSIRSSADPLCQVYVGNLPWSVSWQELKDLAVEFGDIRRADVPTDQIGRSRGYGTVVFSTKEQAVACIAGLDGRDVDGRALNARLDSYAAANHTEPNSKVYIGNLPWSTRWQDLKALCAECGEVTYVDCIVDQQTGRPKGFGIATFKTSAEAQVAIQTLDGHEFEGRTLSVRLDNFGQRQQAGQGQQSGENEASPTAAASSSEQPAASSTEQAVL